MNLFREGICAKPVKAIKRKPLTNKRHITKYIKAEGLYEFKKAEDESV